MGLAISIVAMAKEKVWYHKCANRGRGCTNTKLVEQGGCTIWYDEPTYLKDIESKIGSKIPDMDPKDFSVEGILAPIGASGHAKRIEESEKLSVRAKQILGGDAKGK
eukprot:Selendium_serpulae@DN4701_c0_g1_i1.p1